MTSKRLGIQKSFGMELSMNGVRTEEDWVSVDTEKAEGMFSNQGVQPSAIWMAAFHLRV